MTFQEPTTLDTYESICDYARKYSESLDDLRWILGDCANTVTSRYGDKTIEFFARDIGQRKGTIYQYAKVAAYYPNTLRRRILEQLPNINYSHMRDAMRCSDDFNDAWDWLKECSDNGWSADESSRRLTKQIGHETRESYEGVITGFRYSGGVIYIQVETENLTGDLANGTKVTIKIKD